MDFQSIANPSQLQWQNKSGSRFYHQKIVFKIAVTILNTVVGADGVEPSLPSYVWAGLQPGSLRNPVQT